jgi:hypothetical protein
MLLADTLEIYACMSPLSISALVQFINAEIINTAFKEVSSVPLILEIDCIYSSKHGTDTKSRQGSLVFQLVQVAAHAWC